MHYNMEKEGINMSDMYVECLIKAKQKAVGKFFKIFLIMLAAMFGFLTLLGVVVAFVAAVLCAVGAYFVNLHTDIEYEYLYVDKELTIDKVLAKTKRKRMGVYHLDRMEIVAPIRSYHLDNYKNRQVKELDYSIGEELKPDERYAIYYEGGQKLILSPSEDLVKVMKNVAPRKVFME